MADVRKGGKDKNTPVFQPSSPARTHTRTPASLLKPTFITCFLIVELRLPLMRSEQSVQEEKQRREKVKTILYYFSSCSFGIPNHADFGGGKESDIQVNHNDLVSFNFWNFRRF